MKKIYLSPETECAEVGAIFALCDGTIVDNGQTNNGQDPFGNAPGRRVF